MGAHSLERSLPGKLVFAEVQKEFSKWHAADRQEYGNDPYNGSWSTIRGIQQGSATALIGAEAAQEYCLEHASKWGNAVAVRYTHVTKTAKAAPTFEGKAKQDTYGGKEPIVTKVFAERGTNYRLVAADQLSDRDKKTVIDLYTAMVTLDRAATEATGKLRATLAQIEDSADAKIDPWPLRALHKAKFDAIKKAEKAKEAYKAKAEPLRSRLYTYTENREERWMVAGWAAS